MATRLANMASTTETKNPFIQSETEKEPNNPVLNPNYNNLRDLYINKLGLEADQDKDDENEQMILKIMGKLSPYMDTLDSLSLSRCIIFRERRS